MKKYIILIFTVLTINLGISQEKVIPSKIIEATVFQHGAQITRKAKTSIKPGKTILVFDNLPLNLNDESVLVTGIGNFTILSVVNQSVNESVGNIDNMEIERLNKIIANLNDTLKYEQSKLEIYKSQFSLLAKLDNKFDPKKEFSLTDFKEAIDFQNKKLSEIKLKELQTNNKILNVRSEVNRITSLINKQKQLKTITKKQVVVTVSSKIYTTASFKVGYYINNAGWHSTYDIRVKDISHPVKLMHKANVYQNIGEDWNNVMLTLSNGNPIQSGVKPELLNWYLDFTAPDGTNRLSGIKQAKTISGIVKEKATGNPLPGANIMIQGTSIGAISDFNGRFSIQAPKGSKVLIFSYVGYKSKIVPLSYANFNVALAVDESGLDEVVVIGYGTAKKNISSTLSNNISSKNNNIPVKTNNNQTSVEYKIKVPYTVRSDSKKYLVQIQSISLPSDYQYYCVPKLDKDAFLIAKITNWEKHNLNGGSANLYFEGTYLGKSNLNLNGVKDTLYLSLGRDKNIKVERNIVKEESKNKSFGNKKLEEKIWNISIKNLKKQPISLLLEDQIPLSIVEEIVVEPIELNKGKLDEETGKVNWIINLPASKEKSISFSYSVKYPSDYKINNVE